MEARDAVLSDCANNPHERSIGDRFIGFMDRFSRRLSVLGSVLTLLMALFVLVDVFCRIFLRYSIKGSLEMQQYALATIVFFALPYAIRQKAQVSIDLVFAHFSPKTKAVFESIFSPPQCISLFRDLLAECGPRNHRD